jgi:hypothetical protein
MYQTLYYPATIALEIGPGRGAWTKALLPSKEVWVLDALSAKRNRFFEYLGDPTNVEYFQVMDFECNMLPNEHFTYMFSFGTLCHVSFEGIMQYANSIFSKLRRGSNCFWMIADYDKYNNAIANLDSLSIWTYLAAYMRRSPLKPLFMYYKWRERGYWQAKILDEDDHPIPGRWYHAGIERTCSMLHQTGYQIVDPDVGTISRDPIVHQQ